MVETKIDALACCEFHLSMTTIKTAFVPGVGEIGGQLSLMLP